MHPRIASYQLDLIASSCKLNPQFSDLFIRVVSKNRPGHYWAIDEGIEGYLMREGELFRIVQPSLHGSEGSISFESTSRPGYYICNRGGDIFIESQSSYGADENTFKNEASWFARKNIFFSGYTSFESVINPGYYIRHKSRRLKVSTLNSQSDKNDASFLMSDAAGGGTVEVEERWQQFLGKIITLESKAVPGYYWHVETGGGRKGDIYLSRKGDAFRLVRGLSGEGISFESVLQPGYYLRWTGNKKMILQEQIPNDGQKYQKECSFNAWDGKYFDGYTSFNSGHRQEEWIRSVKNRNNILDVTRIDSYAGNSEASFLMSETTVIQPPTTQRPVPTTRRPVPATTVRQPPIWPRPSKILVVVLT